MVTFADVFERKEVKYRLSARQYRAMVAALADMMIPDEYGCTDVISIYLDTPERALIDRSLEKPLYKEKLRLRSYGAPRTSDRVFVEIKKKYRGIVYKRRVGLSYAAARAYLGGASFSAACVQYPLPNPVMDAESRSARSMQISREIDSFMVRHRPLCPSMLIACRRTAYVLVDVDEPGSVAGERGPNSFGRADIPACTLGSVKSGAVPRIEVPACASDGLRITFDADIAYRDLRGQRSGHAPRPLLDAGAVVMEVKADGPFPLWLVRALDSCRAYPSSFSKYGEAYRVCEAAAGEARRVAVAGSPAAATGMPAAGAGAERLAAEARLATDERDARSRRRLAPQHAMTRC